MPFEKGYTPWNYKGGKNRVLTDEEIERNRAMHRRADKIFRDNNREHLRDYQKGYYIKNHDKITEQKKQWRLDNPDKIKACYERHKELTNFKRKMRIYLLKLCAIDHYSGGTRRCACCGETRLEFLTIDHLQDAPHKRNRTDGGTGFFYWLKKHHYPKGFRILCMNCNFAIGKFGYCPHKPEDKKREMLTCYICKKPFIKISEYEYKPGCDHLGEIVLGIGGTNANRIQYKL